MHSDQFKPKSYLKLIKKYIFSEGEQFPLMQHVLFRSDHDLGQRSHWQTVKRSNKGQMDFSSQLVVHSTHLNEIKNIPNKSTIYKFGFKRCCSKHFPQNEKRGKQYPTFLLFLTSMGQTGNLRSKLCDMLEITFNKLSIKHL